MLRRPSESAIFRMQSPPRKPSAGSKASELPMPQNRKQGSFA
nr:MAG TPA: hypothetical protein [Caudoviricetes sp.]